MTTLRQIHHCATALAEYGHRLPREDQFAWRVVAGQLQPLSGQWWACDLPWEAPAGYAEAVRALRGELESPATSPAALVAGWLDVWLAERRERAVRRVLVTGSQDSPQRMPPPGWARSAPGWVLLRVSGVTERYEADGWRAARVNNAAELICAVDGRPWDWYADRFRWEMLIGPLPAPGGPPARQLAAELERLVAGLNPGWWIVSTLLAAGQRRPDRPALPINAARDQDHLRLIPAESPRPSSSPWRPRSRQRRPYQGRVGIWTRACIGAAARRD